MVMQTVHSPISFLVVFVLHVCGNGTGQENGYGLVGFDFVRNGLDGCVFDE